MKRVLGFLILTFGLTYALSIQITKPIELNKSKGVLVGEVIINNKLRKAKAIGNFKLSTNRQSVLFTIEKIYKDDQIFKLNSHPTAIKQVRNRKIPKGSKIILAGENEEEIAKIFGMSARNYQKTKTSNANPTSGGNPSNPSNSDTGSISNNGGSGNISSYYPNSSSNSGTQYYPVTDNGGGNNSSGGNGNADSIYSSQYCKSPRRNGNEMILSIVDKDGNCYDIQATRDDTKCTYRYDFNNGVAIKQTQFYYVDKENETQNIGGCVDLEGNDYQYKLYADDSKCKLQSTDDKGYGGGSAYFFQTQILFRGADGTIQVAKDCSDFANVKEELLSYDISSDGKTLKRVVNKYYIDPNTGEKVYISNGVNSDFEFKLREYVCGDWEYDDVNLQAYRKTQIRAYDEIEGAYYNATGCDYTKDGGKSGKITQKYTKVIENNVDGKEEEGDINGTYAFEVRERELKTSTRRVSVWCNDRWDHWSNSTSYTSYSSGNLTPKIKWKTTYKTRNVGTTIGWQRPKQENEEKATIYYTSKSKKIIERTPVVEVNDAGVNGDYLKYYEVQEDYYKDESIKSSEAFSTWLSKYYRKGKGSYCQVYNFWNETYRGIQPSYCGNTVMYNYYYNCSLYNDYLIPSK